MRAALVLAAATLALGACNKESSADAHLKAAGDEAKAAAQDVGKAIGSAAPVVKDAGRSIGDDLKKAGDEAAPSIKAAGRDIKDAAHKAGAEIKHAGRKAKDSVQDDKDGG